MKCLIRGDVNGWAFDRRSQAFSKYPPEGWLVASANNDFQCLDKEWDAVFLLDCNASPLGYGDVSYARLVASHAWIMTPSPLDWRTRGCSDSKCISKVKQMLGRCGVVAVYNKAQKSALESVGIRQRIVMCPYSVDCAVFQPAVREPREKMRVSWAYQVSGMDSFKGLSSVVIPLIAELGNEVEWDVQTPSQHSCMNTEALVRFYQESDVYLCSSSGEGGPQGPFEAAACGAIPLSTRVGQMADWSELDQARLLVPSYGNATEAAETVRQMASRIRELIRDRETTEALSRYIVDNVRLKWNAEVECPKQLVDLFGN